MRHTLPLLLVLIAGGFAWYLTRVIGAGDCLRDAEQDASQRLELLMRAQEQWRSRVDRDPESPPYANLQTLIERGDLPGFTLASEFQRTGATEVARAGDYFFEMSLKPGSGSDGTTPKIGGRYQVWAWPAIEGRISSLLFWGSNAGYLIQGENGQVAGAGAPPYGAQPLREVTESRERAALGRVAPERWVVLLDIREPSEVAHADS